MKYRTKPCVIEAVQWNGKNYAEVKNIVGDRLYYDTDAMEWEDSNPPTDLKLFVDCVDGCPIALGEYVYKENNELFVCAPNVFERTYEKVEE